MLVSRARITGLSLALSLLASASAFPVTPPSERLMTMVLSDHFMRYYCLRRYPSLRTAIQRAYDASRFRFIAVPCHALVCATDEYSHGMQKMLERANEMEPAEAREACTGYGAELKSIEEDFLRELDTLSRARKRLDLR